MIDDGAVLARGGVDEIKARVEVTRVRVRLADPAAADRLPGVTRREDDAGGTTLFTGDADALVRALVRDGTGFSGLEVTPVSLEEAFLVLTGDRDRRDRDRRDRRREVAR